MEIIKNTYGSYLLVLESIFILSQYNFVSTFLQRIFLLLFSKKMYNKNVKRNGDELRLLFKKLAMFSTHGEADKKSLGLCFSGQEMVE